MKHKKNIPKLAVNSTSLEIEKVHVFNAPGVLHVDTFDRPSNGVIFPAEFSILTKTTYK